MNALRPARTAVFAVLLGAWAALVGGRLVQLQIVRGDAYCARARRQQERTVVLPPRRGSILDRQGRELAVSVEASSVFAVPDKIGDAPAASRAIARVLGVPPAEIAKKLSSDKGFVWIARQIDDDAAAKLKSMKLPGVALLPELRRSYPNEALAGNALGYVGVDGRGLAGIEYEYDAKIHGREGEMRVSRDARQEQYALTPIPGREGRPGATLSLTLDRDLQFVAEKELAAGLAETGAKDASAVAMDPDTGEVLAMATVPSFDPNRYAEFPPSAWRNRPISDSFEPGSVFKVISGAAVIEAGVAGPSDPVDCGMGSIQVGRWVIHDAEHERFGVIPLSEVIAKSSNVGMVRVGLRLGPQRLFDAARALGIGVETGIDLPGENPGLLRVVGRWSGLSNAELSFGQEVAVTPVQIAVAVGAIANGGLRVQPRMVRKAVDAEGREWYPPAVAPRRAISPSTAAAMNGILKGVVAGGTGKRAAVPGYVVAGKTGTAQKAIGHGYARDKYVATFAGYAPADHPRIVLVVTVDEPRGQYFASEVAAPIFSRILARALAILEVPPDGAEVPAPPPAPPIVIARRAPVFASGVVAASLGRSPASSPLSQMPDLSGLPARRAIAELSRRGVAAELTGSGFVVSQTPPSGASILPGMTCRLRLSESSSSP
ncbi:MAG TPA: penicillin-binding protein [Thermoanaerobaculia bacterium]|nr:penicillin-binding protein [Thermoanaerobaculia bacterium]